MRLAKSRKEFPRWERKDKEGPRRPPTPRKWKEGSWSGGGYRIQAKEVKSGSVQVQCVKDLKLPRVEVVARKSRVVPVLVPMARPVWRWLNLEVLSSKALNKKRRNEGPIMGKKVSRKGKSHDAEKRQLKRRPVPKKGRNKMKRKTIGLHDRRWKRSDQSMVQPVSPHYFVVRVPVSGGTANQGRPGTDRDGRAIGYHWRRQRQRLAAPANGRHQ